MPSVEDKRFGCKIIIHDAKHESPINTMVKFFTGFKFDTYMKWKWYFRYLTAKYQVENPRKYVEWRQFSYEYTPPVEEKRESLQNKIRAAKGKVTQFKNKMEQLKNTHDELFPVEEHPLYPKVIEKLKEKKDRLKELQNELSDINT